MSDTSPLIRIKAALAALRGEHTVAAAMRMRNPLPSSLECAGESKALDLHIGVVGHAVMQSKVHHKVAGNGATGTGGSPGSRGASGSVGGEELDDGSDDDAVARR